MGMTLFIQQGTSKQCLVNIWIFISLLPKLIEVQYMNHFVHTLSLVHSLHRKADFSFAPFYAQVLAIKTQELNSLKSEYLAKSSQSEKKHTQELTMEREKALRVGALTF